MTIRTPEEIAARLRAVRATGTDLFGFCQEVLVEALDFGHARQFLDPDMTAPQWDQQRWSQHADTETYARWYLEFAIDKILDHRSGSASRSVQKLAELAWLLGRDDLVTAMDDADYPMYGAPKVKTFADGLGWPFTDAIDDPELRQMLARMAAGHECDPDGCAWGCRD
ncbi:hypothetical protein I0C86_38210 [Plantactinospora sp. S1510]|uniref:Uncharacterized protein n=1 Tax=Plantactinospora alkalitolerans TaxID=2789879 RepID=A0ABS0H998_9ACTN|nr:hypothetical protein [Plantactinospora alkalitolerans]MBF9134724.1 hypothetical protein [Plantactinospora alkalitolerans]